MNHELWEYLYHLGMYLKQVALYLLATSAWEQED